MLAAKVIRQAVMARQSCAFRIVEEWLRTLYGVTGPDQESAINRLSSARVLVFDEIGFEPSTEFSARALYEVINARMLANRNGLVVTSNLSLDQLASRLRDDRIPSRLGGMCKVVELSGRDYRQPMNDL
jgi:DNA replication protein DnaC